MSNKTTAFWLTMIMWLANYMMDKPQYFLGGCIFAGVYLILDDKKDEEQVRRSCKNIS